MDGSRPHPDMDYLDYLLVPCNVAIDQHHLQIHHQLEWSIVLPLWKSIPVSQAVSAGSTSDLLPKEYSIAFNYKGKTVPWSIYFMLKLRDILLHHLVAVIPFNKNLPLLLWSIASLVLRESKVFFGCWALLLSIRLMAITKWKSEPWDDGSGKKTEPTLTTPGQKLQVGMVKG